MKNMVSSSFQTGPPTPAPQEEKPIEKSPEAPPPEIISKPFQLYLGLSSDSEEPESLMIPPKSPIIKQEPEQEEKDSESAKEEEETKEESKEEIKEDPKDDSEEETKDPPQDTPQDPPQAPEEPKKKIAGPLAPGMKRVMRKERKVKPKKAIPKPPRKKRTSSDQAQSKTELWSWKMLLSQKDKFK